MSTTILGYVCTIQIFELSIKIVVISAVSGSIAKLPRIKRRVSSRTRHWKRL